METLSTTCNKWRTVIPYHLNIFNTPSLLQFKTQECDVPANWDIRNQFRQKESVGQPPIEHLDRPQWLYLSWTLRFLIAFPLDPSDSSLRHLYHCLSINKLNEAALNLLLLKINQWVFRFLPGFTAWNSSFRLGAHLLRSWPKNRNPNMGIRAGFIRAGLSGCTVDPVSRLMISQFSVKSRVHSGSSSCCLHDRFLPLPLLHPTSLPFKCCDETTWYTSYLSVDPPRTGEASKSAAQEVNQMSNSGNHVFGRDRRGKHLADCE